MSVSPIERIETRPGQVRLERERCLIGLSAPKVVRQHQSLTQSEVSHVSQMSQSKTYGAPKSQMLDLFIERFFNRLDAFYEWSRSSGHYVAVRKPVTPELVQLHLEGRVTLSVPALDCAGHCRWCAWDSDHENGLLDNLEAVLRALGWNPIREGKRSGRDGHLWLFFDIPVPALDLLYFDKEIRRRLNISASELEFFPKQAKADLGNGLRLPLGFNRKVGVNQRGWFREPEKNIEDQLSWFAEQLVDSGSVIIQHGEAARVKEALDRRYRKFVPTTVSKNKVSFERASVLTCAQKPSSKGWYLAHCPLAGNHKNSDRNPSLGIKKGEHGQAIVHCFAGCRPADIINALKSGLPG
jgi:hypothetical protein